MKSIGIDIGTSSIKVVEVTANNKGQLRVSQFIDHPLGQNPAFDPEIEIIEFLRGLAATYEPATTKLVMALRQEKVSVRFKTFPFNDRLKIQKSLPFELEEDLPFSSETAIFDAKVIRTKGNSAEVLACATPKSKVQEHLNRFGDIGFEISILSAEGVALANCFENWFETPPAISSATSLQIDSSAHQRELRLVVSIGHTRTLITAFEGNRLVAVRSILWGGKAVAEAIARRYEIPYIEALKEMQTKAFILLAKEGASYDQIVFSDTIANQVRDLARDLKISILEITSELNAHISSVGLTGGASQIINLHAFLTQSLELPVNRILLLEQFPTLGFERSERIDANIGVALGLAIEGLKKPRNPTLQFLRGEFAIQNNQAIKFWHRWGVSLQFAAAIYIVFFAYSVFRENITLSLTERTQDSMKEQATKIAKLGAKQANEVGVKKYIREQKKHAQELKTLSGLAHMNSALDLLKKINDAVPAKGSITLNLKKWSLIDNLAKIEGTVASVQESSLLKQSLLTLAADGKITAMPPSISADGATSFAYSFKVDRGVGSITEDSPAAASNDVEKNKKTGVKR